MKMRILLAVLVALWAGSAALADEPRDKRPINLAAGDSLGMLVFQNGAALPPSGGAAEPAKPVDLASAPTAERRK